MDTPIFDSLPTPACGYGSFDPAAEPAFFGPCDLPLGHGGEHAVTAALTVLS